MSTAYTINDILDLASGAGFDRYAALDAGSLEFLPEVREMCAIDRCRSYGRSWSCPPAVGSLERVKERAGRYSRGIIVQTIGKTDGDFDIEAINAVVKDHQRRFDILAGQVRHFCPDCLPMGAGACRKCRKCTYPDRPCRYPGRMYPSMEAYGLLVSDVCLKAGLEYNYGDNTMTFTSCILTD